MPFVSIDSTVDDLRKGLVTNHHIWPSTGILYHGAVVKWHINPISNYCETLYFQFCLRSLGLWYAGPWWVPQHGLVSFFLPRCSILSAIEIIYFAFKFFFSLKTPVKGFECKKSIGFGNCRQRSATEVFEPLVKVEEDKDRASWSIFNKGEELAPIDKYIFLPFK